MCCMSMYVHVLCGVIRHVWLYVYDAHYVYVYMVEEKALGVFRVWQPIQCAYKKDQSKG